ncbi:hypothetical protein BVRB_013760 [Beta vulgaris subsp. vulgaris]|uniref:Uncharacterized protein n=1 Tax=Beta vulgaris subsp. vulgaris TaxID=3555 RepID=A0A0J8B546_BETVV|nr:hypothetical protein BVRB_013760 [Beta vulgaris subsp. vulgaris]
MVTQRSRSELTVVFTPPNPAKNVANFDRAFILRRLHQSSSFL